MNSVLRRFRPLLISIVALVLTAGIAFAAKPSTPGQGLTTAGQASGKTVPVVQTTETTETVVTTETTETTTETSESGDHCATDPTGLTADQLAALNHGAIVCWAAHQTTPDGYANHGAWVSHWAKMKPGAASANHPAVEHPATTPH